MSEDGFLSRWSRRKADAKAGREAPPAAKDEREAPTPVRPGAVEGPGAAIALPAARAAASGPSRAGPQRPEAHRVEAPPMPTLGDVEVIKPGDGVARFVVRGVDEAVKRAAVKKLFADPHFNVMDGLDVYIDDYSVPDPIPASMLREMNQSKFLKLFADEEEQAQAALPVEPLAQDAGEPPAAVPQHSNEDADLQLQPHDPARREGA